MAKRYKGTPRAELEQRAEEILGNCLILYLRNNRYKVESQSEPGKFYEVCFLEDWSCTCPYHAKRHSDCKHIIAVQMRVMKTEPLKPTDFVISKPAPKCTNGKCRSTNCKFYELRPRKSGGASDRYRCVECGRRFTYRPGFLGGHYEDACISVAIEDYTDGKSLGAAARSASKKSPSKSIPARSTVLRWMQYVKKTTAKIAGNIPLRVGGKWGTDELYFPTDKGGRYMAGVMDTESRFMLANETYPEDEKLQTYDATNMFERAVRTAKAVPDVLVSDRLSGF